MKDMLKTMLQDMYDNTVKQVPKSTATPLMSAGFGLLIILLIILIFPIPGVTLDRVEFISLLVTSQILVFGGVIIRVYLQISLQKNLAGLIEKESESRDILQ